MTQPNGERAAITATGSAGRGVAAGTVAVGATELALWAAEAVIANNPALMPVVRMIGIPIVTGLLNGVGNWARDKIAIEKKTEAKPSLFARLFSFLG